MKEIVTLQIGKCGNNIGSEFWEIACAEHGLDRNGCYCGSSPDFQLPKIGSFFREIRGLRYTARAVVIDLDRNSMESVKSSPIAPIFRPDNFVYGQGGTGNNWAKGHLTEGVRLKDIALEIIRKEAENTDCLQGFQVIHSIGGGTGSGLGSLILNNLKEEYHGRNVSTFTIVPSPGDPKSGMEIYNAILSFNHLIAYPDVTYTVENLSLHKICSELKDSTYNLNDLNFIIASTMSSVTSSMRFQGQCNTDFTKIAVNFVPFPRMHFLVPSLWPITMKETVRPKATTVIDLIHNIFLPRRLFMECDVKSGKFIALFTIFRGDICMRDVIRQMEETQNKNSSKFVEWIPDNAKSFVYKLPPNLVNMSATLFANVSTIRQPLKRLNEQFSSMFKRKAFLEPFKSEGLEEAEFEEAASGINELVEEYRTSEVAAAESAKKDSDSEET